MFGQVFDRLKYADKLFDNGSYYYAVSAYEDVLDDKQDSLLVASKIAVAYDKIGNVPMAKKWYEYLERLNYMEPEELVRLIELCQQMGDYEKSNEYIEWYKQRFEENSYLNKLALQNNYAVNVRENGSQDTSFVFIDFEKEIDSITNYKALNNGFSELSANYYKGNQVVVTTNFSNDYLMKREHTRTGETYYKIMLAETNDDRQIVNPTLLKVEGLNNFHIASATYDEVNDWLYFSANTLSRRTVTHANDPDATKWDKEERGLFGNIFFVTRGFISNSSKTVSNSVKRVITNEDDVLTLKIYRGCIDSDGIVKFVEELPFNGKDFSCSHPSLSSDGKYLYFSSDMEGGYGGSDIYRVEILDDASFSEPQNLGPVINTPKNEIFPHIRDRESVLFFSSDGMVGFGGHDIYVGYLRPNGEVARVMNLGESINTSRDELAFLNDINQKTGYLSSNRLDTLFEDKNSILGFDQHKVYKFSGIVSGNVTDFITKSSLKEVNLLLIDDKGNIVDSIASSEDGSFQLMILDEVKDLKLIASLEDYHDEEISFQLIDSVLYYTHDIALVKAFDYNVLGQVRGKDLVLESKDYPLPGVDIQVLTEDDEVMYSFMSDTSGLFREPIYHRYGDRIKGRIVFKKKGYNTINEPVDIVLGFEENVLLYDTMYSIEMFKLEQGGDINAIVKLKEIYYDLAKWNIRPDAAKELDKIVKFLNDNPDVRIEIRSHTDTRGDANFNMNLSDQRARSARIYIVSRGIDSNRIRSRGMGLTKPVHSNKEINALETYKEREVLHEKNRRTEFIIIPK
jgi:outer membrane protein OmpA-like peptidoglycan-associated protein/tetratricopeptide (TPR) repeat protein